MSNYYIFFIPYIVKCLIEDSVNEIPENLSKIKIFLAFFSNNYVLIIYFFISNQLYGKLVLNPQEVYGTNISAQDV